MVCSHGNVEISFWKAFRAKEKRGVTSNPWVLRQPVFMGWMSFSFDRYALGHVRTTLDDIEAEHTVFVQPLPSCYVSRRTFGVSTLRMSQACDVLREKEKSAHI